MQDIGKVARMNSKRTHEKGAGSAKCILRARFHVDILLACGETVRLRLIARPNGMA